MSGVLDSGALGISENVKVGQKVNIAPLLKILEGRLRANVVSATGSLRANFGGHGANIPRQTTASATVNQFFGSAKLIFDSKLMERQENSLKTAIF